MIRPKPSLTIAIPAYNEEANIANLLNAILKQKQKSFSLKTILVYSDAGTDATTQIVKTLKKKHSLINLIKGKKRMGKNRRVNQIFRDCKNDLLVLFDADIGIHGTNFLNKILQPLIIDKNAQMISAHQTAIRPQNFIGKIIYATFILWDYIRFSIPDQDHIQNFYSSSTAFRGSFARTLNIPNKATEERIYLYMMAKKVKGFRYCRQAHVVFWPPATLHDYLKLSCRTFGAKQPELEKLFGEKVNTIHIVPWKYKIIGILKSFYHQPVYTPLGILLGYLLNFLVTRKNKEYSAYWKTNLSTKKPITI
ncbi:glycosyltransferase [Patescibacteria group bacterium]|nr:glycosyltransferase [Patescibacteria group bacterium]MBU4099161.1 glycosyltransferase [Patescibacteria group bacterium]